MEPQGASDIDGLSQRGRNKRERVSQDFRSLGATPVLRRVDLCGELRREPRVFVDPVGFPGLASGV